MTEEFVGLGSSDLLMRALAEDHAAIVTADAAAKFAHQASAERMRRAAAGLLDFRENGDVF